jgi:hypothetical protein
MLIEQALCQAVYASPVIEEGEDLEYGVNVEVPGGADAAFT